MSQRDQARKKDTAPEVVGGISWDQCVALTAIYPFCLASHKVNVGSFFVPSLRPEDPAAGRSCLPVKIIHRGTIRSGTYSVHSELSRSIPQGGRAFLTAGPDRLTN